MDYKHKSGEETGAVNKKSVQSTKRTRPLQNKIQTRDKKQKADRKYCTFISLLDRLPCCLILILLAKLRDVVSDICQASAAAAVEPVQKLG